MDRAVDLAECIAVGQPAVALRRFARAMRGAPRLLLAVMLVAIALHSVVVGAAAAADLTARQVTELLFKARQGDASDLASKDLSNLDLSGLDFKGARLTGSRLYGVDLSEASLAGADLSGTTLDRAVVIKADFSGANIRNASLQRLTVFSDLRFNRAEAPRFRNANLSGSRILARLDGADFSGADLSFANFAPYDLRGGDITVVPRVVLMKCDFKDANLAQANLSYAQMQFSNLAAANLRGTNFAHADLTQANLAGADVAGANFAGADLYGADFRGARGLSDALGLAQAINLDKALR